VGGAIMLLGVYIGAFAPTRRPIRRPSPLSQA
jgi:hypothetical protein